jgi:nucleoside-triphosphatase THEP1
MQNIPFVTKLEDGGEQLNEISTFLRTEQLDAILGALDKGQNVWITGDYGSGKTTLLLLIERNLLATSIDNVHKINMGIIKNETEFFDSLYDFLKINKKQRTPESIIRNLEKQKLLLLVDEFSVLESNPDFSETFSDTLRYIIDSSNLQMAVASRKLIDQSKSIGSPLINIFVHISLPPFDNKMASSILKNIAETGNTVLDESVLQKAIEIAGGSPRTIHQIGSLMRANNMDLGKVLKDFDLKPNLDPAPSVLSESESLPEPSEIITQYGITEDGLEKHATSDKPIHEVKQDSLGFDTYVNALRDFIVSKDTSTPITISIDGPWGTGKSSLMLMLKGKLDPQRDGVRKVYEWILGFIPGLKWLLWFLFLSPAKLFGKMLVSLTVRTDADESDVYLYFGQKNSRFLKYISDIVEGFSTDPEALNLPGNENIVCPQRLLDKYSEILMEAF